NGNGGGNSNGNDNGNGNGNEGGNGYNFEGLMPVARECTYQDFLKLDRTYEVKDTSVLSEEQNSEDGNDLTAYTRRFQELVLLCTRMVPDEEDKVERFIGGLLDNIQGNVIAAQPTRLQDAIRVANNLLDQKLKGYARNAGNKRSDGSWAHDYSDGSPECCFVEEDQKMPNTRSGATMTREVVNELIDRRVAEALEAHDAAINLETLVEGGGEQEDVIGDDYEGGNGGNGNGGGNRNGGVNRNGNRNG
ncbi:hypothetical protein Tco_1037789, partial [Tanacetum coccineum]